MLGLQPGGLTFTVSRSVLVPDRLAGYSGDDITNICRDAALNGMRRGIAGKTPSELMKMKELGQVSALSVHYLQTQRLLQIQEMCACSVHFLGHVQACMHACGHVLSVSRVRVWEIPVPSSLWAKHVSTVLNTGRLGQISASAEHFPTDITSYSSLGAWAH